MARVAYHFDLPTTLTAAWGNKFGGWRVSGNPGVRLLTGRVSNSRTLIRKGDIMAGAVDKAKGRVKKAVGELTGNEDLKREGDIDKVSGQSEGHH